VRAGGCEREFAVNGHRGVGRETAYVSDDPRTYYAVVESSNLDWTFTVQEGSAGTIVPK
jgi:hypothetical protein